MKSGWLLSMNKCKIDKIVLNSGEIRKLLRSFEMEDVLANSVNELKLNGEYEIESYTASSRAVVEVRGDDGQNGLLKGLMS